MKVNGASLSLILVGLTNGLISCILYCLRKLLCELRDIFEDAHEAEAVTLWFKSVDEVC